MKEFLGRIKKSKTPLERAKLEAARERDRISRREEGDYLYPYECLASAIPNKGLTAQMLKEFGGYPRCGLNISDVILNIGPLTEDITNISYTTLRIQEVVAFKGKKGKNLPDIGKL